MANIEPLCHLLNITINELFAGEYIKDTSLQRLAEKNVTELVEETERLRKINSHGISGVFVAIAFLVFFLLLVLKYDYNWQANLMHLDILAIAAMIGITLFFLVGTHLLIPFVKAFGYLSGKKAGKEEMIRSYDALSLVRTTLLVSGMTIACLSVAVVLSTWDRDIPQFNSFRNDLGISIARFSYGLIGYIVFYPLGVGLKRIIDGC